MRVSRVAVADVGFVADFSGALFWEEQSLLVVSDLHLEKGSSFASRGVLLPPYDTVATLSRLAAVIARHDPRQVIALGDSFHDRDAHARLSDPDREALAALQIRRNWIWIAGNHDPALPSSLGGVVATEVAIGPDRVPPRADRCERRDRRPSAPQGAGADPRPLDRAALLRQ
ncbi:DNA ligase-associated metallophosphoesterase [Bradyrhizobium sp. USDA 3364]